MYENEKLESVIRQLTELSNECWATDEVERCAILDAAIGMLQKQLDWLKMMNRTESH